MKEIRYYFQWIALTCFVFFASCGDDDKEAAKVVFPEAQKLECTVGEEKNLTFEATADWALTSSALWCSFVVNGEKVYSCSGSAGQQSVTVRIKDDATELMKSYKAELTMMMNGERQVICTITRPTTEYEVRVYNQDQSIEYTRENPIVQDYSGAAEYVVVANFDWVAEYPQELAVSVISGSAGEKVVLDPSLVKGFTKEAWQAVVNFKNKENKVVADIPVKYEGIPADRIEFSLANPFGTPVTFSVSGDSYTISEVEYEGSMPIVVTAKDNQYAIVYVDYKEVRNEITWEYEYEFKRMTENDSWFWTEDDQTGNVEISAGYNNDKELTGYLMVFPVAVYEAIKDDFDAEVFSTKGLNKDYDRFVGAKVVQVANSRFTTGFDLADAEGNVLPDEYGDAIEPISYVNAGMDEDYVLATYGTTNLYILALPNSVSYPSVMITPRGYTGYDLQVSADFEGKNTLWNGVEKDDAMLSATLYGLEAGVTGAKDMVVSFLTPNGETYAVLLISRY